MWQTQGQINTKRWWWTEKKSEKSCWSSSTLLGHKGLQNLLSCGLIQVWARLDQPAPSLADGRGQILHSCNRLWICCLTLHHVLLSGAKPQEGVWRCCQGLWWFISLLICSSHECPINVLCACDLPRVEGLCKEGCVFTLSDQRFCHTQKSPTSPFGCGVVWENMASADGSVGYELPHPKHSHRWFQDSCWVCLSCGWFGLFYFSLDLR